MSSRPFFLVTPATRGLSLALTRNLLKTTHLPVYATHRSDNPERVKSEILSPLKDVDPSRLNLFHLDLNSENSIERAANSLAESLESNPMLGSKSYIHTAFLTGGILHPEKQPADLNAENVLSTFQINVISHLYLIKHFSKFLPVTAREDMEGEGPSKWVHVTARVGSIADNKRGGWYSYRASKAALNQVIKTFDLQLQMKKSGAICVGVHPGTMRTELSREFWDSVPKDRILEPDDAASRLLKVVGHLTNKQRGRVWDWEGKEVPW